MYSILEVAAGLPFSVLSAVVSISDSRHCVTSCLLHIADSLRTLYSQLFAFHPGRGSATSAIAWMAKREVVELQYELSFEHGAHLDLFGCGDMHDPAVP